MLWSAVAALQKAKQGDRVIIYSASKMSPTQILNEKVKARFGISIDADNCEFVALDQELATSLDPSNYPSLTHLWQALASIKVCSHAVSLQPCDIFVDTMGVGFAYPIINLMYGISIYSYTHYPIVN